MGRHYLDAHGPWKGLDDVEIATAEWVHWYNTTRPHSAIAMHTPVEHESAWQPADYVAGPDEQTTNHPQPATAGAR